MTPIEPNEVEYTCCACGQRVRAMNYREGDETGPCRDCVNALSDDDTQDDEEI